MTHVPLRLTDAPKAWAVFKAMTRILAIRGMFDLRDSRHGPL